MGRTIFKIVSTEVIMTNFSDTFWNDTHVLVTGGASFIGSHLVDKLVSLGSNVTVVDDLSSGSLENLQQSSKKIKFIQNDLEYISKSDINQIFKDKEIVFHLAAVHGGRGYITTHPADVSSNYSIDYQCLFKIDFCQKFSNPAID